MKMMTLFRRKTSRGRIALDQMVDETIAEQIAKRSKINTSPAIINERVAAIAKQVKLSPAQFEKGAQPARRADRDD